MNNPTQETVLTYVGAVPYIGTARNAGIKLNDGPTSKTLHLVPGQNTLEFTGFVAVVDNTKLEFDNYDNDLIVYVEGCQADIDE